MHGIEVGQIVELAIDRLGYGGVGIARHSSGLVCLVGKTLPGELVFATCRKLHRRHATFELKEIVQAAPQRKSPVCRHFAACGGCHFQHLNYADQLDTKFALLCENLERDLPQLGPLKVDRVIPAEPALGYRSRNLFHVAQGNIGFVNPATVRSSISASVHAPTQKQLNFSTT